MKTLLTIVRWVVGLLFIFSGLVKANDPLGLSYKMQEFFDVWGWHFFNDYTLAFSIIMNVFEVLAGVAVIIGWRMKLFSWLLLLLIIFFSFLTGYAVLSGKIKTCGCFGDCIPLSAVQSFMKDIILLILILVLFVNKNKIHSSLKPFIAASILIISVVAVSVLQGIVLRYLPVVDCLPYKAGNNISEQMKMPAGAIPDSTSINYQYKKNGKIVEFDMDHFPADFDSTYEYVNRFDKVVRKGTGGPKISDFSLHSFAGIDSTQAILSQSRKYVMIFIKDFSDVKDWKDDKFGFVVDELRVRGVRILYVTSQPETAAKYFDSTRIMRCDATVIKTAARANPTYIVMNGANILAKFSYADADKVYEFIDEAGKP
ncbi:BT_3928 family protein [Chitinophagaceae bacterium LWZ2-11]